MALNFQTAAPQLAEAFQGEEGIFSHHDPSKKVYVLVVAGEGAAHYEQIVKAIGNLTMAERTLAMKQLTEAMQKEKEK